MSLLYWLPLNGNINNNGLSSLSPIPSATPTYSDNGKIGKCLQSGLQYISLPLETIPKALSICVWVKPNSPNAWTNIFSLGVNDNRIEVSTTTQYYWYCNSTSTTLISHGTALFTLDNSVWNHVCMTADGTTVKFYLNGVIVKTVSQTNSFSNVFGSNLKINIGARVDGTQWYYGYMNDVRIYNHCLSAKEVKEISKGLVCHYPLKSQYETGQVNKYSGDVAEGSLSSGPFAKTKLEGERGYNYKISYTGTGGNMWVSMNAGYFSFTVGKKYYYSCKVRCHSTNFVLELRASRSDNDWVTNMTNVLNPDGEWHEYVVYQTINSTYDRSGSTVTCNPILEFYTESLVTSGKVYSADFDIKDVQVIESNYYVPFIDNDMVSNVVSDCSGYENNGTKVGDIALKNDSPRYSGCYDFNGTGYVKNTSFNLNATEMTISFWVKIRETNTNQHFLFGTFKNWTINGIGYYRDANRNYYYGIIKSSAESEYTNLYTPGLTANIWYHIAIVYTGTECILYVNGVEDKRVTYGKNGIIINPVCYLGNSLFNNTSSSETDESSMSDFRIYTTALSAEEVKALYNTSASIDKTGVLSAYEFVEEG